METMGAGSLWRRRAQPPEGVPSLSVIDFCYVYLFSEGEYTMKTHRCTTADELPAVKTVGDGLAAKIAGNTARGGAVPLRLDPGRTAG